MKKIILINLFAIALSASFLGDTQKIEFKNDVNNSNIYQVKDSNVTINQVDIEKIKIELKKTFEEKIKTKEEKIKDLTGLISSQKKNIKLYEKEVTRLEEEVKQLKHDLTLIPKRVENITNELNKIDLSKASKTYQKAYKLFKEAKLDEAIKVIDEANITEESQKLKDSLKQNAETLILKAQMHYIQFKFDKAKKAYKNATTTYPSVNTFNEFGNYLYKQRKFKEAEKNYKKALALTETKEDKAKILNNIGELYRIIKDYKSALKSFNEALKIRRELAKNNPSAYLPDVAGTLNNIANLYLNTKDYKLALSSFNEAFKSYKELNKIIPNVYLSDIATISNNMGALYLNTKDYKLALNSFNKAFESYKELDKIIPNVYLPEIAKTLNNIAFFYIKLNDNDKAKEYANESIEIKRELFQKDKTYGVDLTRSLITIAFLSDKKESKKLLIEAKKILESFPKNDKEAEEFLNMVNKELNQID